ncbi:MAG: putative FAD-linked oxidoreductase [Candidatus Heimdallarchaeota archaeon AB_125]|nr:MAG: putative FAD-linked oxidoreductase [Candidatus Heimdallarchaeota archaeon AB_125]
MTHLSTNVIITEKKDGSPYESINKVEGSETITSKHPDYIIDESKLAGGSAELLFFPKNESEIITIVKKMKEKEIPITISGGRTGIVGGAVPFGGAVVSTDEMTNVTGFGYDESNQKYFVRIQPGITLDSLDDIIKHKEISEEQNIGETSWVTKFKQDSKTYMFAVDPTEMSAAVGGAIAANASGARSYKYGPMRPWVKRMRIVLANGDILDITRDQCKAENGKFVIETSDEKLEITIPNYQMPKAKNAAGFYSEPGMDVIELFIGTEGMLGFITEVDLWIIPTVEGLPTVMFFISEEDAITFVEKLRADEELDVEYMEYFDEHSFNLLKSKSDTTPALANLKTLPPDIKTAVFFEVVSSDETLEEVILRLEEIAEECNSSIESCWSAFDEVERENLRIMRHAVPETVNGIIAKRKNEYPGIHKLGTDMSVEHKHFREMMNLYRESLEEHNLESATWGHIGDSHVHVNILPRNLEELELGKKLYKKFAKKAVEFGGSVSAEHGIGKIKAEYLVVMYGEDGVNQMRSVKNALDPLTLFCKGNMFD